MTTLRVGAMRYEVYASASYSVHDANKLPWITYDEAMAHLPQARWIATTTAGDDEKMAFVRVNDAEAVLQAVIAGLGRSLLPCVIADGDARLMKIGSRRHRPALVRELWLLTHSELRTLGRIEAVVEWIKEIAPQ